MKLIARVFALKNIGLILILTLLYYLVSKLTMGLSPLPGSVRPFWPAAGVAVVFVLKYGYRVLPGVFFGAALVAIDWYVTTLPMGNKTLFLLLTLSSTSVLFAAISRYLICRYVGFSDPFVEEKKLFKFLLLSGPVSALIPMIISIFSLTVAGEILPDNTIISGVFWWIGDSLGVMVVVPLLLILFDRPGDISPNRRGIVILPAVILFASTIVMFFYSENRENEILTVRVAEKAKNIAHKIEKNLQQHIAIHFKGHIAEQENLSLSKFEWFAKKTLAEHPDISHIEWGVLVSRGERELFEQSMQKLYGDIYFIKDLGLQGELVAATVRDEYLPIKYVYPHEENRTRLGYDPSQQQGVLNTLLMAKNTRQTTISERVELVKTQSKGDPAVIVYVPVYSTGHKSAESNSSFVGYLVQVLNIRKFIEDLLLEKDLNSFNIVVSDVSEEILSELYLHSVQDPVLDAGFNVSQTLSALNRVWSVSLTASPAFLIKNHSWVSSVILIAGLILTVLVIFVQLMVTGRKVLVDQIIEEKTASQKAPQGFADLLAVTFESHQAIIITDDKANILRVNKAFTEITGYAEHEVLGKNPRILSSGRQSVEFYRDMWSKLLTTGKYDGEIWNRRKNGEVFPELQTITVVKGPKSEVQYFVCVFSDITIQKQTEERNKHYAFYDPLTLLPNRRLLMDRLEQELKYAHRYGTTGAVLVLDLDDFTKINKTIGYKYGDDLLIILAKRLASSLRDSDTIARMEGDEYVVILSTEERTLSEVISHAILVAEKMLTKSRIPFILGENNYPVTSSIGISLIKSGEDTAPDILRQADSAMYKAKANGKNCFCFFDGDIQLQVEKNRQ